MLKKSSATTVKIWPCVPLEPSQYFFRGTNLTYCFEFLPIELTAKSPSELAFVNPETHRVQTVARKAPCPSHRHLLIEIDGQLFSVDQITGINSW